MMDAAILTTTVLAIGGAIACELQAVAHDCHSYSVNTNTSCGIPMRNILQCPDPEANFIESEQKCARTNVETRSIPSLGCTCDKASVPDPLSKNSFYTCTKFPRPVLIKRHRDCFHGGKYNASARLCTCDKEPRPNDACVPILANDIPPENCLKVEKVPYQLFYYNTPCTKPGLFPDAFDCNRYYLCRKNKDKFDRFGNTCPLFSKFDAVKRICTDDPSVKCPCTNRDTAFQCTAPGLYPDPACSSSYYICAPLINMTYTNTRMLCQGTTEYDPKSGTCSDKIKPEDSSSISSDSSSSSSDSSSSSSDDSSASDDSSSSSDSKSSGDKSDCDDDFDICKYMRGSFGVDGDRKSYYVCENKKVVRKYCKHNTHYNKFKKACI